MKNITNIHTVFQSPRITVESATQEISPKTTQIIEYPILNNSITIIPIDLEENIIFTKQYSPVYKKEILTLPTISTTSQNDFHNINLVQKKLQSTINFTSPNIISLGKFFLSPDAFQLCHIFLATKLKPIANLDINIPKNTELVNIRQAQNYLKNQPTSTLIINLAVLWANQALGYPIK